MLNSLSRRRAHKFNNPATKLAGVAMVACLLAACSSGGRSNDGNNSLLRGDYVEYNLPETTAEIKLNLLLTSCTNGLKAKPTVSIIPKASKSSHAEHHFRIEGSKLAGFLKQRELKITLHDHGSLKSVNASVSDKTAAIIGNIFKIATAFVGFDPSAPKASAACNQATVTALQQSSSLKQHITRLRRTIANNTARNPKATSERIDILALELARIERERLSIELKRDIGFVRDDHVLAIQWKDTQLKKWLNSTSGVATEEFSVGICTYPEGDARIDTCTSDIFTATQNNNNNASDTVEPITCGGDCSKTLVFRDPIPATLRAIALSTSFDGKAKDAKLGEKKLPIAQWGNISFFPLTVGFGRSKSLALTFDEYGRRTSFGLTTNAAGEGITSGIAGVAEAAGKTIDALNAQEVEAQAAEIKALETQQKLNKLEECRSIIENGGYKCPE